MGGKDDLHSGWMGLTALAGKSNRMLVGCFKEKKKVRRQWVSFLDACSASGSGRQVGNMQFSHGFLGVRT